MRVFHGIAVFAGIVFITGTVSACASTGGLSPKPAPKQVPMGYGKLVICGNLISDSGNEPNQVNISDQSPVSLPNLLSVEPGMNEYPALTLRFVSTCSVGVEVNNETPGILAIDKTVHATHAGVVAIVLHARALGNGELRVLYPSGSSILVTIPIYQSTFMPSPSSS